MRLERRMAWIFTAFSCLVLVYNFVTPDNPDHIMNLVEQIISTGLFGATIFLPIKASQTIHIIALIGITLVTVFTDTGFFPSAVLMVFIFVLTYAYGGFRTFASWKIPISAILAFVLCLAGSSHFQAPGAGVWSRAAMWTLFVALFLGLLWLVLQEVRRQFFADFAHELTQQNHDLLGVIRDLEKGCKDGDDA